MDNKQPDSLTDIDSLAKAIQTDLVPHLPYQGGSEDRSYSFRDPVTERDFEIRQFESIDDSGKVFDRYFLSEFQPNGRMCETNEEGHVTRAWDEPLIQAAEAEVGPNGQMAKLREAGIDTSRMVRMGGGLGVNTRWHASLGECSREIVSALLANVWYVCFTVPTEQEKIKRAVAEARSSHDFWLAEQQAFDRANATEDGLFKGCTDMMGGPLDKARKDAILSYLNAPSQEKWLEIRSLIVTGHGTLWQAWGYYDPAAPNAGNKGFPAPDVLTEALRAAVANRAEEIQKRRAQTSPIALHVV